jgi:hypothetical protein
VHGGDLAMQVFFLPGDVGESIRTLPCHSREGIVELRARHRYKSNEGLIKCDAQVRLRLRQHRIEHYSVKR